MAPSDRRDHLSFLSGTELFIIGGHQGNHKEHCTDHFKLDVTTMIWEKLHKPNHYFCNHGLYPVSEGISGTSVVAVCPQECSLVLRGVLSLMSRSSQKSISTKNIQIPGYYVFGGMTNTGVTNRLTVIDNGGGFPKFTLPFISGQPPRARFLHSSHFLENKAILVIVGGKLAIGESLEREIDIFALELMDMRWVKITTKSRSFPTVCAHAADTDEDRIYIFGGIDKNNYRENEITVIDIESDNSVQAQPKLSIVFSPF